MLEIKRGSGSFLPKLDDELELAKAMIDLGARHGCPVVALVTAMDRPLGHACGNALEVAEAIDVLKGGGPPDLVEVTLALGAAMLVLAAAATSTEAAHALMRDAISSGRALLKLEEIVKAQVGMEWCVTDRTSAGGPHRLRSVQSAMGGAISRPRAIGYASSRSAVPSTGGKVLRGCLLIRRRRFITSPKVSPGHDPPQQSRPRRRKKTLYARSNW